MKVRKDEAKQRLDHYLTKNFPDISRGFLQKLCADGLVKVNDTVEKSGHKLKSGDKVIIEYDMSSIGSIPDINLPIIYEDDNVLVIDKPAGVLSHALTKFHNEPSVASFLRQHLRQATKDGDDIRFGIVHRLDRVTSGVMICAKNHPTMRMLQDQFAKHSVKKMYTAVVTGRLVREEALIDVPLERNPKAPATFRPGPNGKPAQTRYKTAESSSKHSLVHLWPQTGRTHQLRVHMKYIGHPIVGDVLYGGEPYDRLLLHANVLSIIIPEVGHKDFTAPIPKEFDQILRS